MDFIAELQQLEKAMHKGADPLQLMMDMLLFETEDPVAGPVVERNTTTPHPLKLTEEAQHKETVHWIHDSDEECDLHGPDSLQMMLEELLVETGIQLPVSENQRVLNRPLQQIVKPLLQEGSDPLLVCKESQCDPQTLQYPPHPPTVLADPSGRQCSQTHQRHAPMMFHMMEKNLVPIGVVNNEVIYALPPEAFNPGFFPATPLLNPTTLGKRKLLRQQDDTRQPYIKKPPNAFMLFRQEQRSKVGAELNIRDSAVINTELGKRWTCLSEQEKLHYFNEADKLSRHHEHLYPGWSTRDNYGKRRKRTRRKCPNLTI
ncbi:hypothetical protein JOB18_030601 [Solea senegalensis]|uniref:HMG box domain-containing protein n=1 Tax=Solea senegalensis TaxID=28829 RepID=A0AAV6SN50_SOLSE|nr:hypothetical protein JOB18_030601 [Solea senegalensis]